MENVSLVTGPSAGDLANYSLLQICQCNGCVISGFWDLTSLYRAFPKPLRKGGQGKVPRAIRAVLSGYQAESSSKTDRSLEATLVIITLSHGRNYVSRVGLEKTFSLPNLVCLALFVSFIRDNGGILIQVPKNCVPKRYISGNPTFSKPGYSSFEGCFINRVSEWNSEQIGNSDWSSAKVNFFACFGHSFSSPYLFLLILSVTLSSPTTTHCYASGIK